jgi:hypothetical protein
MIEYKVTLSNMEEKALSFVANSQQEWIDAAVHERCRVAIEEIIQITIQKCIENNIQIPLSKEDIVSLAFEEQWIKTAFDRNIEIINS